jgi:CBS domain containing-hemolysin-like protein
LAKKKLNKKLRFWALKVFIISLILTAGISVIIELLMDKLSITAAAVIILLIVLIGVVFDIIGIAFATCEAKPFVSMASKKIKRAKSALVLLRNASVVSNICGDVVGDICGIVSGAAGAAIAIKIIAQTPTASSIVITIAISSVIAAVTVAGKAAGKKLAINNNKQIVSFVSYVLMFFLRDKQHG